MTFGVEHPECMCERCVKMCRHRVCWGTPEEINTLIDLGYAKSLMCDYWVGSIILSEGDISERDEVYIICPAIKGYEGKTGPEYPYGPSALQTDDGLCSLHSICKPIEGRYASCNPNVDINCHALVATLWSSHRGREIVEKWRGLVR